MPSSTMKEKSEYALPEDIPFPGILKAVEEKAYPYKSKKDGSDQVFKKWVWEFQITEGEFAPLRAWGETEPELTTHPDNLVRQWGETLRDKQFEIGEDINTDDLLGLPCLFTVRHEEPRPKKDGSGNFYGCRVADVFPIDALQSDEPPF